MSDRTPSERAPSRLQVESCSGSVTNRNSWRSPPQSGVGSRAPFLSASCCSPSESEPWAISSFADRVIARLEELEKFEQDPWYADDLRIARLTVIHAWRGDAVECSPHVLASYEVLGVHPDQVWPKIEARRAALGPLDVKPVRKKPVQSVSLWCEKTNAAMVSSPRGGSTLLRDNTISVPMAAPSIAAGYPNSGGPTSGKKGYTYDDFLSLLRRRGASHTTRKLLLDMVGVRGPWPKENGPISAVLCVSVKSLTDKTLLHRSTIQRRMRRAQKELCLRQTREMNSWLNCPKCGSERNSRECPNRKCGHRGNGFDHREFRRTFTYEMDFTEIERLARSQSGPQEIPPAASAPVSQQEKPAAEHRSTERATETRSEQRGRALRAGVLADMSKLMSDGFTDEEAVRKASSTWGIPADQVRRILKECEFEPPRAAPSTDFPVMQYDKCGICGSILTQNPGAGPRLICLKCRGKP